LLGDFNICLLSPFRAASQQDDKLITIPAEIDPLSGAEIEAKF
jgi:hypothetical protein